jgi:hypothetical protein
MLDLTYELKLFTLDRHSGMRSHSPDLRDRDVIGL